MAKFLRRGLLALVPVGILAGAGLSLAGCVLVPGPGGYYAEPAPVYVEPGYYYAPRYHGWHGDRWHGDGWHHGYGGWH